jgi:hypothetical protein
VSGFSNSKTTNSQLLLESRLWLMKLPNSRTKILPSSQSMCYARRAFATLKAYCIAPPVKSGLSPLQRKEDNDSSNGNRRGKRGREDIVILARNESATSNQKHKGGQGYVPWTRNQEISASYTPCSAKQSVLKAKCS